MTRIVRKHYPASRLPEDLREGLPQDARVEIAITVEDREAGGARPTLRDYFGAARTKRTSIEEAVCRVRELREEWD